MTTFRNFELSPYSTFWEKFAILNFTGYIKMIKVSKVAFIGFSIVEPL